MLLDLEIFALLLPAVAKATYSIKTDYSGTSFFNGWNYYGSYDDLTNGDVIFVNSSVANSDRLTYVNSAGNAIIKVDNSTNVPYNDKRNSVRISSSKSYGIGSIFIMDALHLPYGCSVWPSFWTMGANWPSGGEIDIMEGVNLVTSNQVALHTLTGCTQASSVIQSGRTLETNCSTSANDNSGCAVSETHANSYGEAFASNGGGVYAAEFASTGVSFWFFPRASIPTELTNSSSTIDPSSWGTPTASYPSSSCNPSTYFAAQSIILDITLCGDWAGKAADYSTTCSGVCYTSNVVGSGSNYNMAYFEIKSVKVFTSDAVDLLRPSWWTAGLATLFILLTL